ncbi:LOW QUALITY PROTEIN: hypothetical protein HZS_1359 [Henneguya salminicola]|nr:LOW QUALITY PROTEIN: hypothetical protein HZS_1359 [Henneguya salminicola]
MRENLRLIDCTTIISHKDYILSAVIIATGVFFQKYQSNYGKSAGTYFHISFWLFVFHTVSFCFRCSNSEKETYFHSFSGIPLIGALRCI